MTLIPTGRICTMKFDGGRLFLLFLFLLRPRPVLLLLVIARRRRCAAEAIPYVPPRHCERSEAISHVPAPFRHCERSVSGAKQSPTSPQRSPSEAIPSAPAEESPFPQSRTQARRRCPMMVCCNVVWDRFVVPSGLLAMTKGESPAPMYSPAGASHRTLHCSPLCSLSVPIPSLRGSGATEAISNVPPRHCERSVSEAKQSPTPSHRPHPRSKAMSNQTSNIHTQIYITYIGDKRRR